MVWSATDELVRSSARGACAREYRDDAEQIIVESKLGDLRVSVVKAIQTLFLVGALFCGCAGDIDTARPLILTSRSSDITADVHQMWETQPWGSRPREHASSECAIDAADRVFSTVQLRGMTKSQVIALLGDPQRSSRITYNFPFYPAPPAALVYRFDTGNHGWQFNVLFDQHGVVQQVQRYAIR